MTESPQFRRLDPIADPAMLEKIAAFFDAHIAVDVPDVREGLLSEDRVCFYVMRGNTVQAAGSIVLEGEASVVDNLAVAPNRRGRGVGRALLTCLEQAAKDHDFSSVHVFPVGQSEDFFGSCGYRPDPNVGMIKWLLG